MQEENYLDLAEAALARIEAACDRINEDTDADIDAERQGGVLNLHFANGSQIVINLQKPLQEIWLAAQAGGFHYRWQAEGQVWRCTRSGGDLFADVSRYASAQAGLALLF